MDDMQVLTVHEAADAMGVSMQRVRQLIHDGQIVGSQVPNHIYVVGLLRTPATSQVFSALGMPQRRFGPSYRPLSPSLRFLPPGTRTIPTGLHKGSSTAITSFFLSPCFSMD